MGCLFQNKLLGATVLVLMSISLPSISTAEFVLGGPGEPSNAIRALNFNSRIPEYVLNVPRSHFVGISEPCKALREARTSSLNDVLKQILKALGANCSLIYEDHLQASYNAVERTLRDSLSIHATWFVREIEQGIVRSDYVHDENQHYIFFTLVHYPSWKLEKMRTLTIGPRITARIVEKNADCFTVQVIESGGVSVTLTDYQMKIFMKNHNARLITLFAWKVPESSEKVHKGFLEERIYLKGNTKTVSLPNPVDPEKALKRFFLGSENYTKIILQGHDGLGRPVSVPVFGF